MKALIEQGSVRRESGRWKRCDVGELVIPQSVKEAIGSRLNRVSEQSKEVLRTAAVLGKTFNFEELRAAAGIKSEDTLLDALDQSVSAQLIVAGGDDSFTFTHDKIREVLYEELNPIRRRRLHRLAAEGLERHHPDAVERLAYHYIHAGDYECGLTYAKRAAHEAERVSAFDEAIAAYNRAFECAEALGHIDEQVAQQEAIGKVYMLHGETIAAGEHFENALALTSDPSVRIRLQLEAASSLVATGDQRAVEYVRAALGVLDPSTNPLETARALSLEGRSHHLAGRHLKAIELLEQAADLVAPTAAADSITSFTAPMITQIYAYLAGANQHYGRYVEADLWARRAIDFGAAHNVLYAQALGFEYLGENSIHKGDFQAGLKYADTEFEIIEKLQSRERRVWTHFVAAMCSFFTGDSARAEREYTEGIEMADGLGEFRGASLLRGNLAILKAHQANKQPAESASDKIERQRLLDEALQLALENFKAGNSLGLFYSSFEAHRCLAEVRFRRGELDEAECLCAATSELISGTESRVTQLWLGPLYMDVLLATGKRAESEGKLNEAAAKFDLAAEQLARYQSLVAECQSPRFTREAERLANTFSNIKFRRISVPASDQ